MDCRRVLLIQLLQKFELVHLIAVKIGAIARNWPVFRRSVSDTIRSITPVGDVLQFPLLGVKLNKLFLV